LQQQPAAIDTEKVENGKSEHVEAQEPANGQAAKSKSTEPTKYVAYSCGNTDFLWTSSILEKGLFYFFFRPRVQVEDVTSLADVQKSYLLLRPTKSDLESAEKSLRIIQIPKKSLPSTGTHERFLAFVIASDEHIKDLKDDIGENHYSTATRGERVQGAARPVAEGVYAIVGDANGRTSHFAYMLTLPAHATVFTFGCHLFTRRKCKRNLVSVIKAASLFPQGQSCDLFPLTTESSYSTSATG
jgi:hypothetical protein